MAAEYFRIAGGTVYDPRHGVNGEVRDVWIAGGKIVAPPGTLLSAARSAAGSAAGPVSGGVSGSVAGAVARAAAGTVHAHGTEPVVRTLDATGLVVMPGGIDMHSHIAGPKVNTGRKMRPEEKRLAPPLRRTPLTRSGTMGSVPSSFATGYKYAGMGYTTVFDAAIPPLAARHAHEEFADTPCLDKGFYLLMGNNHYVMRSIRDRDPRQLDAFMAWLLGATRGYGCKLVNPGGVEMWKQRASGNVRSLDERIDHFDITPRDIVRELAAAADRLELPHSVHIHCNNLGLPGNWTTTLETMRCLEGHRGHLTHIQFHSYGGGNVDEDTFCSRVAPLADFVNSNPHLTVDVGQVMFGDTTSMTGDGPLGYYLHQIYGTKWFSADIEMESGCGIAPIKYRNRSLVHSLQWAIGLEWYLMVTDPWRVVMSTDHPNGGSFLAYPQIIRLLMDSGFRREALQQVHPAVRERTQLADIDREYTLYEIAIITRAGPARILGLEHKGHLGIGADADVTIYTPHENKQTMFETPRCVIKDGELLVDQGEIRATCAGRVLHVAPSYDVAREADIARWFESCYSIRFRNYPVAKEIEA